METYPGREFVLRVLDTGECGYYIAKLTSEKEVSCIFIKGKRVTKIRFMLRQLYGAK